MKYAIGCDEAAIEMKKALGAYLAKQGVEVIDFGVNEGETALYPDIARKVAVAVQRGEADRAVLCCGTGLGMAICANKVKGIRATVCHDLLSAERSRKSNDAQIFCVGARVIAPQLAVLLLDVWHHSEFAGGGSGSKVKRIAEYEEQAFLPLEGKEENHAEDHE